MKPAGHIVISAAIGATVAAATDTPWALATTLATGVMVDIDHSLDYYRWFVLHKTDRVFYLFHGWEYVLILSGLCLLAAWHPLMLGAVLGYLSHLIADQIANRAYPLTYSLAYRVFHGFQMNRVSSWTVEGSASQLVRAIPFGRVLVPWVLRVLGKTVAHPKQLVSPL